MNKSLTIQKNPEPRKDISSLHHCLFLVFGLFPLVHTCLEIMNDLCSDVQWWRSFQTLIWDTDHLFVKLLFYTAWSYGEHEQSPRAATGLVWVQQNVFKKNKKCREHVIWSLLCLLVKTAGQCQTTVMIRGEERWWCVTCGLYSLTLMRHSGLPYHITSM